MRTILLLTIFCLFASNSYANVYVIYHSANKSIYTVSEKDDTLVPDNHEQVTLGGTIEQLGLVKNPVLYRYVDGDFIQNNVKINQLLEARQRAAKRSNEIKRLERRYRKIAKEQLEAEGVVFTEITNEDIE